MILKCDDLLKSILSDDKLKASLTDDKGKALVKETVTFTINGRSYDKVTDLDGNAYLNINLKPGDYDVKVTFKNLVDTAEVLVVGKPSKLSVYDGSFINGSGDHYVARLTDGQGNPLKGYPIDFYINKKHYNKITDDDGRCSLAINLDVGVYDITTTFKPIDDYVGAQFTKTITVTGKKTEIQLIKQSMIQGEQNIVRLIDDKGNALAGQPIHFFVENPVGNKKKYIRHTDSDGKAKLNINLNPGTYNLTYHYVGYGNYSRFDIAGKIHVTKKITEYQPVNNWYISHIYPTSSSILRQETDYTCGANSVQVLFYMIANRYLASEMTLANKGGTTVNGVGHGGLQTMINWLAPQLGLKVKIEWKDFVETSWYEIGQACANPKKGVFCHLLYKGLYGHYEPVFGVNLVKQLICVGNSLSNGSFRGWEEDRSFSRHLNWTSGISQKSWCIVTIL